MKTKNLFSFLTFLSFCIFSSASFAQDTTKIYTVDEIIANAPKLIGQTVTVKGKAQHVCTQSGRKIFLQTADAKKTLRFNAGKDITKFDPQAVGKQVTITGVVFEQKVTLELLEKQLEAAKKAETVQKEGEHCASDAKAQGQDIKLTPVQRIQAQIDSLKKQTSSGGNPYLSYYSVFKSNSYKFE